MPGDAKLWIPCVAPGFPGSEAKTENHSRKIAGLLPDPVK
jgi:hypothetical protein